MCRAIIRKARWDREKTQTLRDNLAYYHREWDEKRQIFKDKPDHDHSSHDADCARYLGVGWSGKRSGRILTMDDDGTYRPNVKVRRSYDPSRNR